MPSTVSKKGDKYRVVEKKSGLLTRGASGTPVDGGGHKTKAKAKKQADVINISQSQSK